VVQVAKFERQAQKIKQATHALDLQCVTPFQLHAAICRLSLFNPRIRAIGRELDEQWEALRELGNTTQGGWLEYNSPKNGELRGDQLGWKTHRELWKEVCELDAYHDLDHKMRLVLCCSWGVAMQSPLQFIVGCDPAKEIRRCVKFWQGNVECQIRQFALKIDGLALTYEGDVVKAFDRYYQEYGGSAVRAFGLQVLDLAEVLERSVVNADMGGLCEAERQTRLSQ
jgi:hypothetical protein